MDHFMKNLLSKMFVVGGLVLATAAPAAAQSFEAEIDCGGVWFPGDSVPFTLRFEEQAHVQHSIDLLVTLMPQGAGTKTIISKTFTLNSNQDRQFTRFLDLKATAPLGDYDMQITADDGTLIVTDTCGFNVTQ
jgi:hypothetical protein